MASSKFMMNMSSSTSRNSDLIRRKSSNSSSSSTSINRHHNHPPANKNSGSSQMTIDGLSPNNNQQPQSQTALLDARITLLDAAAAVTGAQTPAADSRQESVPKSSKSVDDVWKDFMAGRSCKQEVPDEMMTLEDFLAKAGAVEEEDIKIPPQRLPSGGIFSYDNPNNSNIHPPNVNVDGFSIGGKKRGMLETLDKAAQQRQRRMIKNRESAARSRERKQAYQAELESLAVKLEEENEALMKVKTEQTRKRYKQLMESIIPVTEKQKPRRNVLRRVRSMEW